MMDFEESLVSGAPHKIYAMAGSLFELHEPVMDANRAAMAGIHYLFELYGAAYYRHTASADMMIDSEHPWSAQLLEQYNNEKHCHAAASVVLRIDDAIVQNSVVYCRAGEAISILYESFRFPDRAGNALSEVSLRDVSVADFEREDRAYLYLGSSGSFNYGHWLIDDLPRAKAWLELRQRLGITCVIVLPAHNQKIDEVRVSSLRMLIDPLIEVEFVEAGRPCRLRNLYYVTPVSFHPRIKNPAALHFARSRAAACLPGTQDEPTRKLFVARRPPNIRSIVNFDELWAFLAARGFEMVEAEGIDFAGQISLFQNARIVVGQMGAAMTNTLFCQPATNLVYLAPTGWAEPFYLDLAALGGQQYNILAGPPASEGPAYLSDFAVPLDHLYHRLAYMGFTETGGAA
jgi:capsular polysaccharide biosynthesis protein